MKLPPPGFGKNPVFPASTRIYSLILAEGLVAQLHETLAEDLS